jgi:GTP-binding protein YchF
MEQPFSMQADCFFWYSLVMKIGIVGFPGSGKTTLFNALTGQDAPTGFGGGKVNLGVIKLPDRRVDRLSEIDRPRKKTYAEMTFADVPGGRGSSSLDPQTLGRIREMDALVQVVRGFDEGLGTADPAAEITSFEAELILGDMQVAEKRVERLRKDLSDPRQLALLTRALAHLEGGAPLRELELADDERASLSGFAFLSLKPLMTVLSQPEGVPPGRLPVGLQELCERRELRVMPLCGPIEAEIAALDRDDQPAFLADLGLEEAAATRFIKEAFALLDLITFLTRGPEECRAWSIRRGSSAIEAAGTVHSDMARGFIRAEVVAFEDLDRLGSDAACRDAGKLRVEGRDYVVADGDICHFRFNV